MKYKITKAVILMGMTAFFMAALTSQAKVPSSKRAETAIEKQTPSLHDAMTSKGFTLGDPIFVRIIKTKDGKGREGYLEVFVKQDGGQFSLFKTWDICTWSGDLGPKLKQGDRQSPEGFYFVKPAQMNPNSSYHLSFNLGYPNAYDRAHGRTGDFLMVHGNCVSIGCYAMTDAGIEEIYTLMQAAFDGGQPFVRAHIFPFPMTEENLAAHSRNMNAPFWINLKQGWDAFEYNKVPPNVEVRSKAYVFENSMKSID